ncbi:hypothetical protein [Paenibacillus sp. NFR01]|uniref:hypothetical protein n=1 Tax=Paenibacillus sp. NFR01 TaxID=1566279 RepID=UPI0008ADA856|nr:hypothetical protein [Paenibacillus sp. NFR01]SEU19680.1 hypothetical protein SAMN03159358_3905 [Paenibacillus sp. NFR01]
MRIFIILAFIILSGCNSNLSHNSPSSEISVDEPVTWINFDGVKYYFVSSIAIPQESTLHDTGQLTDSDDSVEKGKEIYRSDDFKDSLFIKDASAEYWLEYKLREK